MSVSASTHHILRNYDVLSQIVERSLESIKFAYPSLFFSSIRIGYDQFDEKLYEEGESEFDNMRIGFIKGHLMLFEYPYGTLQYHKKNSILFDYTGFEFIMNEKIIPFSMMTNFGITIEEKFENAKVKIKRSSGKIQNALIDLSSGLVVKNDKKQIYIKLSFFINEKDDEEPIHYMKCRELEAENGIIDNVNYIPIANKHVLLDEFFELNPEFKFEINVENPHIQNEEVYKNYIEGNEQKKDIYDCLNLYYKFKLQEYFDMCHSQLSYFDAKKFSFSIYSHSLERFLKKIKPEFMSKH